MALSMQRVGESAVASAKGDHARLAEAVLYAKQIELAAHMCGDRRVTLTPANTARYLAEQRQRGAPLDRAYAGGAKPHVAVVDVELEAFARVGRTGLVDETRLELDVLARPTLVGVRVPTLAPERRRALDARDSLLSDAAAALLGAARSTLTLNVLTPPLDTRPKQQLASAVAASKGAKKADDDDVHMEGGEQIFGGVDELNSDDDAPADVGEYDLNDGFLVDNDAEVEFEDDENEEEPPPQRHRKKRRVLSSDDDDDENEEQRPRRRRRSKKNKRRELESSPSLSRDDDEPATSDDDFTAPAQAAAPSPPSILSDRQYIVEHARRFGVDDVDALVDPYGNAYERFNALALANALPDATPLVRLFEEGAVRLADGSTVEAAHTYTVDGRVGYTSTTTLLKRYFDEFDALAISTRMVSATSWPSKPLYRDAEAHADDVLRRQLGSDDYWRAWADDEIEAIERFLARSLPFESLVRALNARPHSFGAAHKDAAAERVRWHWQRASELGREFHRRVEYFFDGVYPLARLEAYARDDAEIAMGQFVDWYRGWFRASGLRPFRVELALVDERSKTTGTIDFLALDPADGQLVMIDWKHSKAIDAEAYANRRCQPPLAHLPDAKLTHYALQQCVYREFLHRTTAWRIKAMYLLQVHPTLERARLIEVPDYGAEALAVIAAATV